MAGRTEDLHTEGYIKSSVITIKVFVLKLIEVTQPPFNGLLFPRFRHQLRGSGVWFLGAAFFPVTCLLFVLDRTKE